jgi:simple sugar transport system permease protein
MSEAVLVAILSGAVLAATPILYAAAGEIIAELSGVLNLGVEGMMLVGAMVAFSVEATIGSLWTAVLAGMAAGAIVGCVHAVLTVTLAVDQVVSGLAITLFGTGVSSYLGRPYISVHVPARLPPVAVPGLAHLPYLGPILFEQNALILASYVLVPALWAFLRYSGPGLSLRAVGESPRTADAMGIDVFAVRYAAVTFGGMMAGLAGAFLSTIYLASWTDGLTAGRGWIAIALVVFAAWDPLKAMAGAYLFGFADVMAFQTQVLGRITEVVPTYFVQMTPYILTIFVLVLVSRAFARRRIGAPAGLMMAYRREQR